MSLGSNMLSAAVSAGQHNLSRGILSIDELHVLQYTRYIVGLPTQRDCRAT